MAFTKKIIIKEEMLSYLVANFSNTKNQELALKLGISEASLHRIARKYGLTKSADFMKKMQKNASRHGVIANKTRNCPPKGFIIPNSEKTRFKPGVTPVERLGNEKNKERILKSSESRKQLFKAEKRRVLFGFEQKTKFRVVKQSKSKICFKHTLKKRGYIVGRTSNTIFYNFETNRNEKSEATAKKYGFKILPI